MKPASQQPSERTAHTKNAATMNKTLFIFNGIAEAVC